MAVGMFGPEYFQFDDGGPAAEVEIFVFLPGTRTKAVLWWDKNRLYTRANPVWTDRQGEVVFYAEQGEYDLFFAYRNTTIPISIGSDDAPDVDQYIHTQSVADTIWVIQHNLGFRPNVILEENLGFDDISYAAIRHPDVNRTEIRWGYPASGRATCRR